MSRFMNPDYRNLSPYVPGDQPQREGWIKLNTNESPYPPAQGVLDIQADHMNLYPDPESRSLVQALAENYNLEEDQIIVGNGSDELLAFAFMAFQNTDRSFAFPDLTYGFYPVYSQLFGVKAKTIPLAQDWTINYLDYIDVGSTIVIPNPNAPTGLALSIREIEKIVKGNKNNVVIIDEAYIDFGGVSAISLIDEYQNLLVVQTFSKSRSLAGARIGFAMGNCQLIEDLKAIKYSFNPYNLNSWSEAAALAALKDEKYFVECCNKTIEIRESTSQNLKTLGFEILDSRANFIFAKPPALSGEEYYQKLREEKILVRHFAGKRTKDFVRISIGDEKEMESLLKATKKILENQR
ncbi:MAG: histidinol-phosphate transaminase [Anaerovoracaceae bacterium]|nr:histidinol-phosphate transaminase [Anaerovoracaceae bacterium]